MLALLLAAALPAAAVSQTAPADSAAALLSRGISQSLARHRAATIHDVRYELALDLTARDSAAGRVIVRFSRSDSGDAILDFRGRRLTRALANGHLLPADATRNGHLLVPGRLLFSGENVPDLAFVADIAPTGASIIRTHD